MSARCARTINGREPHATIDIVTAQPTRSYRDRCPGVLRPWIADDGALVRLRLIGGRLTANALLQLTECAADFGDGNLYVTGRANVQIRGIAHDDGCVPAELVQRIAGAGLLPAPSHDLVRNILVSPLTGRVGGRADLRTVAAELDRQLCADPRFASLAGRFLFALDDGRGDISARSLDLGLIAVDHMTVQLRVGSHRWGPLVSMTDAPSALLASATRFLSARGTGEAALWHVDELPHEGSELMEEAYARDHRTTSASAPPALGRLLQGDGLVAHHVEAPDGTINPALAARLAATGPELIVTPWRSIIVPDLEAIALDG